MEEHNNSLSLFMETTTLMNMPTDPTYGWLIGVISIFVNLWSIRLLKAKEDSNITKLVICDCAINIIISIDVIYFNLFLWSPLKNDTICAIKNTTLFP